MMTLHEHTALMLCPNEKCLKSLGPDNVMRERTWVIVLKSDAPDVNFCDYCASRLLKGCKRCGTDFNPTGGARFCRCCGTPYRNGGEE